MSVIEPTSERPADAIAASEPKLSTSANGDTAATTALETPALASPAESPEASEATDAAVPLTAAEAVTTTASEAPPREPGLSPAQTAARLADLFPALFAGPPKPIKLRIQVDIQARAPATFTKRVLSIFLSRHTTTTPYLKALVAETQRYDLDGQAAGEIAAEHKQAAADELARRKAIVDQRRAAERAERAEKGATRGPRRPPAGQRPNGPAGPTAHAGTMPGSSGPNAAPTASAAAADEAMPKDQRHGPGQRTQPRPPRRGEAAGFAGERPPRRDRPTQVVGEGRAPRPERHERQDRMDHPAGRRPPHHNQRDGQTPRAHPGAARERMPERPPEWTPTDPAQRERAALLRSWEGTALTKANFCVLKRLSEADFDAQIAQARQEREAARRAS